MKTLHDIIKKVYKLNNDIYYSTNSEKDTGYWSNITKKDQDGFLSECRTIGTQSAVRKSYPNLEGIIFSATRSVGLRFLNIKSDDVGIDYGCMWGNMLMHSAKKCRFMVGIDQTEASLKFLKLRLNEEKLKNVYLINENLKNDLPFNNNFDFS
ncbi:uncharacterized protein METZ01_LOCUS376104, partial [marine metagenome]